MTKLLIVFVLFGVSYTGINAVNHWTVTENGKIQAFLDSPFSLRKPDDLLALLEQETRQIDLRDLSEQLLSRIAEIEKKYMEIAKSSDIGTRVTTEDVDCVAADRLFVDLDFYSNIALTGSERGINFNIPSRIKIDKLNNELIEPLCMQLTPSSCSESIVNKTNLAIQPEETLKSFLPIKSLDHFGYYVVKSLKENSTSWVHYNLASFYWRLKGEGDKAIDCLRIAVQFVNRNFHDIPLHNLAGILHQSHYSREAIQLLNRAIEVAPEETKHYFVMGNIYATLREFNNSVANYEKLLKLDPKNKEAADYRHAVLCNYKLETALTTLRNDLQNVLSDLHDYHSLQQQWLRLQERLLWEMAQFEYDYHQHLDPPKKIQRCVKKTTDGKPMISCDFYEKPPQLDKLNVQSLFQMVENEKQKLIHSYPSSFKKEDFDQFGVNEDSMMGYPKYPTGMSTKDNQYFDVTGWPDQETCIEWNLPLEEKDNLRLPLYLPPDNKGYLLKKALSEDLNLPDGTQHKLPWYPPICDGDDINGEKFIPITEKHLLDLEVKPNDYLKTEFYKYVGRNADEHEIGQRIVTALEKKTAPRWVLATLASLYWRVRGNIRKTLDCLDMAFQHAPKENTDVVLLSLGSTVHLMGLKDLSLKFATLAFKINYIEPSTNFLLALLHYNSNNRLLGVYYLKNVLRVDPNFYDGMAEKLLKLWSCRIKLGTGTEQSKPESKCMQPDSTKTDFIVCEPHTNWKTDTTVQCVKTDKTAFKSTTVHEQCDENPTLGEQIMASLIAAESRVENVLDIDKVPQSDSQYPRVHHHVHMGLSLGAEHFLKEYNNIGEFYVSLDLNENPDNEQRLHIYDKFGTYAISPISCKFRNLMGPFKYSQLWKFIKNNMIDIASYVKQPLTKNVKDTTKPYCMQVLNPHMPYGLNELTLKVLQLKLPNTHDRELTELLQLICGNQKLNIRELGVRIAKALQADETNWKLLMASAIHWIIYGNTLEAGVCIRGAITNVPITQLDVPLIFLSHLLGNIGLLEESLQMSHVALAQNSHNLWIHFKVAETYIKLEKYELAVPYLRATLKIDDTFDAARLRLKAVLCKLLFEDGSNHGTITAKIVDD